MKATTDITIDKYNGVIKVELWQAREHHIIYSNGTPGIAFTSSGIWNIYHTQSNTHEWIDSWKRPDAIQLTLDLSRVLDNKELSWSRPQK